MQKKKKSVTENYPNCNIDIVLLVRKEKKPFIYPKMGIDGFRVFSIRCHLLVILGGGGKNYFAMLFS